MYRGVRPACTQSEYAMLSLGYAERCWQHGMGLGWCGGRPGIRVASGKGMESRDQPGMGDESRREIERMEREIEIYRRLYRAALESLKAARRMERAPSAAR